MKRIALITGATSGIGAACARKFAEGGYHLILTGRNESKLAEIKKELENEATKVITLYLCEEPSSSGSFRSRHFAVPCTCRATPAPL